VPLKVILVGRGAAGPAELSQIKTASAVSFLVLLLAWESWSPFFAYFARAGGERARHALKNLGLGVLNAVVTGLLFVGIMHKVHHSRWRPETDSNYSSLFSFWDRLFGSFRLRDDPRALRLGLDEFDSPRDQTLLGLLATPLKRLPGPSRETEGVEKSLSGRGP
jgi:sterol desaturase/sphingolipid hydroxylase (fatty acid hydroxylase superfamily)